MHYLRYLAYGSNLHPARISQRLSNVRELGSAALPGWSLNFHMASKDGSGKCNVVTRTNATAYGAIYEISAQDKQILDRIEGVGLRYAIQTLNLPDVGEIYFYTAVPQQINEQLKPYHWYKRFVLEGARYHRLPASYITAIAAIDSMADPDPQRTQLNAEILATKNA